MNDYLAFELIRQRTMERQEEARTAGLVRSLRLARRRRQREDALLARPVPDFVDGSFRSARPGDDLVEAKRAGAAR
jgi:hypothetical protein